MDVQGVMRKLGNRAARGRRLAFALLLLAAMGLSCSRKPPLRIGINAWPGYEFLYLAQVKGFYEQRGVDVHIVEFGSLSDARVALERGQIDGLGTTVVEVLMARAHRTNSARIVRVVDYSDGADTVIAMAPIASIADLKGRRVGVELGSLGVYLLASALEKHQLSLTDVAMVSQDQVTMVAALREGELDAIVTYPPESLRLLSGGTGARVLFSSAEIPGEIVDVIAFRDEVIQDRLEDVRRVLSAFDDALAFTEQQRAEACAVMARREGLTAAEFDEALHHGLRLLRASEQLRYLGPGGTLLGVAQKTERLLNRSGQLASTSLASETFLMVEAAP